MPVSQVGSPATGWKRSIPVRRGRHPAGVPAAGESSVRDSLQLAYHRRMRVRFGWVLGLVCACGFDSAGVGSGSATTGGSDSATSATSDSASSTSSDTSADGDSGKTGPDSTGATTFGSETGDTGTPPGGCAVDNGGCDANATCSEADGGVKCECNRGWAGDGETCAVDAKLGMLRIEAPCVGTTLNLCSGIYCNTSGDTNDVATLQGDPGTLYEVTLRIRGVVEEKAYIGGMSDGFWNEGGQPSSDFWNVYGLQIADPPQSYFVNAGIAGTSYCHDLDYEQTVTVRGNTDLTLSMTDANDCETRNRDINGNPIVVPDIPPDPMAFDGQFVQIDLVEAIPRP
jgi:hypothetical protein